MYNTCGRKEHTYINTESPKKCTHSFIVNIFWTKWHVVTILARYCSVMFAHVSRECLAVWALRAVDSSNDGWKVVLWATQGCIVPGRWIGQRGAIGYPSRSPDLHLSTSTYGEPWGWSLSTLNALRGTIEASCAAITPDTDSRSSLSSSAAETLFSRWWWSLRAHIMIHSLSAQEL
jgi:hypothetical protein